LWWKFWHTFSVFKLESHLSDLSKRHSVARTTMSLISMRVGEVNSFDISPVKVLR
jgi:hypothetical protein